MSTDVHAPIPETVDGRTPPISSALNTSPQKWHHRPGTRHALCLAILILAALLRLYGLTSTPPGLYCDEGVEGSDAVAVLESHHFQPFYEKDNGREGLYVNTTALAVAAFGNQAWVVRLPAAVFGVMTVLGLYLLCSELFTVEVGLFAAFFLSTSIWHIQLSRIAFRAIASPCFLVWALFFISIGFKRLRESRRSVPWLVLAGITYGLGFYTYIAYRVTPLIILLVVINEWRMNRGRVSSQSLTDATIIVVVSAVVTAVPLIRYFVEHPSAFSGRMSQVSVFSMSTPGLEIARNTWKTVMMLYVAGDSNWRHNYAGRPEVYWPVAVLMTIGLVVLIRQQLATRLRPSDFSVWLIALWLCLGALPAILTSEGVPHSLRSILMIPAVAIIAAIGARSITRTLFKLLPRTGVHVTLCVAALLLTSATCHAYFVSWAKSPVLPAYFDQWTVDLSSAMNSVPDDVPKVVALSSDYVGIETVKYLTGTVTSRQQQRKNIRYYSLGSIDGSTHTILSHEDFCKQVMALNEGAAVFCVK